MIWIILDFSLDERSPTSGERLIDEVTLIMVEGWCLYQVCMFYNVQHKHVKALNMDRERIK